MTKETAKEKKGKGADPKVNTLHKFLQIGTNVEAMCTKTQVHTKDGKDESKADQTLRDAEKVDGLSSAQSEPTERTALDDLDVMWLLNRDQNNNSSKSRHLPDEIKQAMEKLEERLVAKVTRQLDDWGPRLEETMLTIQGQLGELQSRQQEESRSCQKCLANSEVQTESDAGGFPRDDKRKKRNTSSRKHRNRKGKNQERTQRERRRSPDGPGGHTQASSPQLHPGGASIPSQNSPPTPWSQGNRSPVGEPQRYGTWNRGGVHRESRQGTPYTQPSSHQGQNRPGLEPRPPSRISQQEVEGELEARALRKRNLVVKGWTNLRPDMNTESLNQEVCDILLQVTGISPQVVRLMVVDKEIVVQLSSLGNKIRMLRRKGNLRNLFGYNLWLDDDLTAREVEVQKWLQEEAERLSSLGARTKVGYAKLIIDGVCWQWNESEAKFICLPPKQPFRRDY